MADSRTKEKEREAKLKVLREELEAEIKEKLAKEDLIIGHPESFARHPSAASLRAYSPEGPEARPQDDVSPKRILEALLFASAKPLTIREIQKIVGADPRVGPVLSGQAQGPAPTAKEIEHVIKELQDEYRGEGRSFELIEIAGGFEIVTRKEYASWLARLELQKKVRQATRSALETLAILAYKQPVTRAEIEELRGVDVSAVLSTLLEKGFIKMAGRKEVPGRPFLYGTTEKFLEHFGLKSLKGLPDMGEIKGWVERAVRKEELIGQTVESSVGADPRVRPEGGPVPSSGQPQGAAPTT